MTKLLSKNYPPHTLEIKKPQPAWKNILDRAATVVQGFRPPQLPLTREARVKVMCPSNFIDFVDNIYMIIPLDVLHKELLIDFRVGNLIVVVKVKLVTGKIYTFAGIDAFTDKEHNSLRSANYELIKTLNDSVGSNMILFNYFHKIRRESKLN